MTHPRKSWQPWFYQRVAREMAKDKTKPPLAFFERHSPFIVGSGQAITGKALTQLWN